MTLPALPGLDAALRLLREVPRGAAEYADADDAELLHVTRLVGELTRLVGVHGALAAGQIAERSKPALGAAGLARREGARTVEELLTTTMRVPGRDAASAVRVGRLTTDAGPLAVVGASLGGGEVSVEAAEAIRAGLGDGVAGAVDADLLELAAEQLCDEARRLDPDRLRARAREVRDELDAAGVAEREAALRARRSLRRHNLRDGMKRLIWDYDPETAGIVDEVYDRATSPRRGGPRFVDSEQAQRAADLERDARTTEQLASDAFAELLRQAACVDEGVLVGSGTPSVRIIVSADALRSEHGYGLAEGSGEAFSRATVERLACAGGTQRVLVDSLGRVLDLGREQRLYSRRQRVALAVRDGGCRWAGCERPPSWTEAHHLDHWARGGATDLERGILLCRHHHLRVHNEGWTISVRDGQYWAEPPPGSRFSRMPMPTKSRALREHLTRRAG